MFKRYSKKSVTFTLLSAVGIGLFCGILKSHGMFGEIPDYLFTTILGSIVGALSAFTLKSKK